MKLVQVILIVFSLFQSKAAISQINGKYFNDTKSKILEFSEDKFVYKYSGLGIPFNCSDTIAFGSWKNFRVNKFVQLNSTQSQLEGIVETVVNEKYISINNGGVSFDISNPIEDNWERFNPSNNNARLVFYRVRLTTDCDTSQRIVEKDFYSSKFKFEIPLLCNIVSFEIIVLPVDLEMWMQIQPPRLLKTEKYYIVKNNTNNFEVRMPLLSECYMSSLPLSYDIIVVKSKNVLVWKGQKFYRVIE